MSIPWYADAVAGVLVAVAAYIGWREWKSNWEADWEKADQHRRAVRLQILAERREDDEVRGRIWLMQARVEDAVSAHCDALLAAGPVPERLLRAVV